MTCHACKNWDIWHNMRTNPYSRRSALTSIGDPAQRDILLRYLNRNISAEIALMNLLVTTPDLNVIQAVLAMAISTSGRSDKNRLIKLSALAIDNYEGCNRITRMLLSGVDTDEPAATIDEGIAFCKHLFDWSVEQCPEASVALYSLGNPAILDAATAEIAELIRQWQLAGPERSLLEIGCGIGRFQKALATDVLAITGIDISANMIRIARSRCEEYDNVSFHECSGRDLAMFETGSLDLVYAVDSFPYLYQSGMDLLEIYFNEVQRVLKPGGDFLILEFSYRNKLQADRVDVNRLAEPAFEVIVNGTRPFRIWDGAAFHLRTRPWRQ